MPVRFLRFLLLPALVAVILPAAASAAPRMFVGFQDDASFRWHPDRQKVLDRVAQTHANVVKTAVYWYGVAPNKPSNPANTFSKGYYLDDLDEFVRNAESRGLDVLLQIWGTPGWANGDAGHNRLPTRLSDLTTFAKALAARYSGRYPGYPEVRMYAIWNESNLEQFLAPQYDSAGNPVAPANYAKLYRAAYAGIKAGNPDALVAIGETSARGRDKSLYVGKPHGGLQETESPGKFAQLLSQQKPALKFDAWGQHPYPVSPTLPPTAKVAWPNVTLTQLPRFEQSLDQWFHRKNIPIWITEYGHQTRPRPAGVTNAQQAAYAKQALTMAANDPRVQMFIWFVFRDDPTDLWQSGLVSRSNVAKPSLAVFTAAAAPLDIRNPLMTVKPGARKVQIRVPALEFVNRVPIGSPVKINYEFRLGRYALQADQRITTKLAHGGYLNFSVPIITQPGRTYEVKFAAFDKYVDRIDRTVTIYAPAPVHKAIVRVKGGVRTVPVKLTLPELLASSKPGQKVAVTYTVAAGTAAPGPAHKATVTLGARGLVSFPARFVTKKGTTYDVAVTALDAQQTRVDSVVTVVAA
jgi:hypothetical protein